jgi:hypothetical protein
VRIAVPLITVLGALVVLVAAPSRSTVAGHIRPTSIRRRFTAET